MFGANSNIQSLLISLEVILVPADLIRVFLSGHFNDSSRQPFSEKNHKIGSRPIF